MKWVGNSADWNDSFRKFNSSLNIPKWALQRFDYRWPENNSRGSEVRRICEEEVKALTMDNGDRASQQAHHNQIVGKIKYCYKLQMWQNYPLKCLIPVSRMAKSPPQKFESVSSMAKITPSKVWICFTPPEFRPIKGFNSAEWLFEIRPFLAFFQLFVIFQAKWNGFSC